jgi:hypothetical protein
MSLDMSPSMFSQPSGIHQPIAGSVMNAIMGHMTQQGGIGNLFSGGNNYTDDDRIGGNTVASSKSDGRGRQLQQDHPLLQYGQQNAGIQDPQQATHIHSKL